jgi:hypothetical protein
VINAGYTRAGRAAACTNLARRRASVADVHVAIVALLRDALHDAVAAHKRARRTGEAAHALAEAWRVAGAVARAVVDGRTAAVKSQSVHIIVIISVIIIVNNEQRMHQQQQQRNNNNDNSSSSNDDNDDNYSDSGIQDGRLRTWLESSRRQCTQRDSDTTSATCRRRCRCSRRRLGTSVPHCSRRH